MNYIMDADGSVREEPDLLTFGRWFENAERHVGDDTIHGMRVSTVFLGIDHSFGRGGVPILFETMIFDAKGNDVYRDRYATRDQAIAGHKECVERLRAEIVPDEARFVQRDGT